MIIEKPFVMYRALSVRLINYWIIGANDYILKLTGHHYAIKIVGANDYFFFCQLDL